MIKAGHTRVLWVTCRHDDSDAIKALKTTVSAVSDIANVILSHRHIGREDRWVAIFTNPVFAERVRALLRESNYPIQAESVIGTPYPMPATQEAPAA